MLGCNCSYHVKNIEFMHIICCITTNIHSELHTIVGAGKGEGSMDMSNMLKPKLARGELQLVGATTLDEYRLIEKDAALARRFQSVYVAEPGVEDTVSILRGLKNSYELHHGIRVKVCCVLISKK